MIRMQQIVIARNKVTKPACPRLPAGMAAGRQSMRTNHVYAKIATPLAKTRGSQ